jgi:hypothetical protein
MAYHVQFVVEKSGTATCFPLYTLVYACHCYCTSAVHRGLFICLEHYTVVLPKIFFHTGTTRINFHPTWNSCMYKCLQDWRQRGSLHRDYFSIATCCAEFPAVFQRVFGIFCSVSKFLLVYYILSPKTSNDVLHFPRDV